MLAVPIPSWSNAKTRVLTEWSYLRADASAAVRAVTPQRRSSIAVVIGAAVVVYSLEQWLPVLAGVVAGLMAVVYGFLFVDLDAVANTARRRR